MLHAPVDIPSIYASAAKITANTRSITAEAKTALKSGISGASPIQAALAVTRSAKSMKHGYDGELSAAKRTDKNFYKTYKTYTPFEKTTSGKYLLRTTVNGVPVIPPGMSGKSLQEFVGHESMAIQEAHAKTLVFISLSMPDGVLRRMFANDVADKPLLHSTVFVLRGWQPKPTGLPDMDEKLIKLFPKNKEQPTIEVDPLLFTKHQVNRVPVVIHETPKGQWGAVVGAGYGLRSAVARIDHGKGSGTKVFGQIWKIAEPNLIDTIKQKAQHYNWEKHEETALKNNMVIMSKKLAVHLPESKKPLNYLWNPSVISNRTVSFPGVGTLVKRGAMINPLRYYPTVIYQHFIIFNPAQPWQVKDALAWSSTYSDVVLMVTRLPTTEQSYKSLVTKFNQRILALGPLLAARLGVRAVPDLISVDHYRLRIQVPAIPLLGTSPTSSLPNHSAPISRSNP
ncbi:conjugal transfer protein TraW [Acidithiobacillus ferrivorans]|nr:conjugal transfer protein TraW [Acidithiobacillus ferrivorans]